MRQFIRHIWSVDKRAFLRILFLNIAVALTGSISIVMLIPMLDLLNISVDNSESVTVLLQPFVGMSYLQRAALLIGVFLVLMIVRSVLGRAVTIKQNAYIENFENELRKDLYQAVSASDWETLHAKPSAELINLFVVQCRQTKFCLQLCIGLMASFFSAALQIAIACWMSLPVTVMVLLVGSGFLMLFLPYLKKSRETGMKSVAASRQLHQEILNQLNSVKEIRSYGVESHHADIFEQASDEYYDASLQTTQQRVIPQLCYSLASAVLIALAFVFSVLVLNVGTAQLIVLVYIFSRLWPMFSSWQSQLQNIQAYVPAYETIQNAISELSSGKQKPIQVEQPFAFDGDVSFDNVAFCYRDTSEPVLNGVSFNIPNGAVTALVGPSGAGKSTTADLLMGLLLPTSGQILVGGSPLQEEAVYSWRKAIGYIPQEPLILNATVRENLLRFHPDATEEEIILALKQSLAWGVVEKLPNGLDTILGDRGVRLSGGERQRIVLARVLLGKPKLIILDEATSALDYECEQFIQETIHSFRGKATVLVIAHRIATIQNADFAVVLSDGMIVEQGRLQDLQQNKDSYISEMMRAQRGIGV